MHLVLAGGGHGHLALLRALAARPLAAVRVTLVTPESRQWYSGMLPGWIAGQFDPTDCTIDLALLARRAGVKLVMSAVTGLDAGERTLLLATGETVLYDLLSLNLGATPPTLPAAPGAIPLLPIKPMADFAGRWQALMAEDRPAGLRVAVVGAGAAGVEVALAVNHALRLRGSGGSVALVDPAGPLSVLAARARRLALAELHRRGVALIHDSALGVSPDGLVLSSGGVLAADCAILASGAVPPDWPRASGLAVDGRGRVLVNPSMRSISHPEVFAVGDGSAREDRALVPSGVHAVKGGAVLAHNLRALLEGGAAKPYRPREKVLHLLGYGERRGLACFGPAAVEGRWVWYWKRWIDRRFIARHR